MDNEEKIGETRPRAAAMRSDPGMAALSVSAGAAAGAAATSGAAMTAAAAGGGTAAGITGYAGGVAILAAHAACETAAAVGLGTVAIGPIVGGVVGYALYRVVKRIAWSGRKPMEE